MSAPQPGTPPSELRLDRDPYPHLRDTEGGCILARDYIHEDKCSYIGHAANNFPKAQALADALRDAVQSMALVTEGNPMGVGKNEKCQHGRYGFEGCENCTDGALAPALDKARAALAAWDAKP